jgi:hypothetical protein
VRTGIAPLIDIELLFYAAAGDVGEIRVGLVFVGGMGVQVAEGDNWPNIGAAIASKKRMRRFMRTPSLCAEQGGEAADIRNVF